MPSTKEESLAKSTHNSITNILGRKVDENLLALKITYLLKKLLLGTLK